MKLHNGMINTKTTRGGSALRNPIQRACLPKTDDHCGDHIHYDGLLYLYEKCAQETDAQKSAKRGEITVTIYDRGNIPSGQGTIANKSDDEVD